MYPFPTTETKFLLPGPAGNIEVLATPNTPSPKATAIICHPHPLHGGTMNNKVVTTLARVFSDLGLPTVRFNFRGVGKSEGTFSEGLGERKDALTIINWVKENFPQTEIWLAGFSFGAAVSAFVATEIPIAQLVTIAPPVPRFDLPNLPPIKSPWIIVQGEEDDVVNPEEVYHWIETLNPKPKLIRIPDAGHFFHGKLLELREVLKEALT